MDNAEEILHSLEEFTKVKPKDIPRELDDYLGYVAKTGDPVYQWPLVKNLFREKLMTVITDFYESSPMLDLPPCPNVDPFNYDRMKTSLLERLESFVSAPFTVQRICELLTNPKKEYNRADKFMRAIEKNVLVVSTREPGMVKRCDDNLSDTIVNGIPEHKTDSDVIHVNVCTDTALVVSEAMPSSDVLATNNVVDEGIDSTSPSPSTAKVWDKICDDDSLPCSPELVEDILKPEESVDKGVHPQYIIGSSTVDDCSAINSIPLIEDSPIICSTSDNVSGSNELSDEKNEFTVNADISCEVCNDDVVSTTLETEDEVLNPSEELSSKEQPISSNSHIDTSESSLPDFGLELGQDVSNLEHEIANSDISNATIESASVNIEVTAKACEDIEKAIVPEVLDSSDLSDVSNESTALKVNDPIQTVAETVTIIEIKEVEIPKSGEVSPSCQDNSAVDNVIFQAVSPENTVKPESRSTIEADPENLIIEEYVSEKESEPKEELLSNVVADETIIPCEERKEGSVIHLTPSVSEDEQPKSQMRCDSEEEAMDIDETSNQQTAMIEGDIDAEPMDQSEQSTS